MSLRERGQYWEWAASLADRSSPGGRHQQRRPELRQQLAHGPHPVNNAAERSLLEFIRDRLKTCVFDADSLPAAGPGQYRPRERAIHQAAAFLAAYDVAILYGRQAFDRGGFISSAVTAARNPQRQAPQQRVLISEARLQNALEKTCVLAEIAARQSSQNRLHRGVVAVRMTLQPQARSRRDADDLAIRFEEQLQAIENAVAQQDRPRVMREVKSLKKALEGSVLRGVGAPAQLTSKYYARVQNLLDLQFSARWKDRVDSRSFARVQDLLDPSPGDASFPSRTPAALHESVGRAKGLQRGAMSEAAEYELQKRLLTTLGHAWVNRVWAGPDGVGS